MVLPADLLLLICEEIGAQHDFKTLFHCALSGKHLAGPALLCLYRIHNDYLRIISSEGTDVEWGKTQALSSQSRPEIEKRTAYKWSLIWRSIIRSSLGTTAYPYALHIRSLDLGNFSDLLDDHSFKISVWKSFFSDDMAKFHATEDTPRRRGRSFQVRLAIAHIVNLVGHSINDFVSESTNRSKTSVALESLSGDIATSALRSWTGKLNRLKSLNLWDGAVLTKNVASAIAENCPHFDDLSLYVCLGGDAEDRRIASFLGGLRRDSLRSLAIQRSSSVGAQTLQALGNHSKSLRVMKLGGLEQAAIKNLSLLKDCNKLETLDMEDSQGIINLEATENDVFLDVLEWLKQCERLQDISLTKFVNAPALVTQVCQQDKIRLKRLKVVQYPLATQEKFHLAISQQYSLETLSLRADADFETTTRDDIDTLVSSICLLPKLKDLDLLETSDYFNTPEIQRLATHLPNLEKFSFAGLSVTNAVWPALSGLHYLRDLNINAITSFTVDGLLNYISMLRDTNQGLQLSVMCQSPEHQLTDEEKLLVQECITAKVDGRFDFVLWREGGEDEYEASDSD